MKKSERMVRQRTANPDLGLFPNFLYLGPQRTGSTWLHANLSRHPEVHLHRDKETFYFSTLGNPGSARFRYEFLEDYLDSFREPLGRRLLKHYHALRRCGMPYLPRIRGDFTASYGVMEDAVVAEIVQFEPLIRGVVLVRDPLERAWSHAKKDLVRGRDRVPGDEEITGFILSPDQLARADYRAIIQRWKRHLAPGHLLVAPYSRIADDPEALLDDISAFLGIRRLGGASKRHVAARQNVTSRDVLPDAVRAGVEPVLRGAVASFQDLLRETGPCRIY